MQKGSAQILFILVTVALVLLGVFFFSQKPKTDKLEITTVLNPKITEQTTSYTNQKLGFELKYPKQLILQEDNEEAFDKRGNGNFRKNFTSYVTYPPADVLGAVVILDNDASFETNPFTVWVFENPDDLTIDKWYLNFWYYPFVWGDYTQRRNEVAPINEASVSGQLSKSGVVDYQPGKPKFIYINYKGRMYLLRVINQEGNMGDQILQSFKLLD